MHRHIEDLKVQVVFVLFVTRFVAFSQTWNYYSQGQWGGSCTTGTQQSPINFLTISVIRNTTIPALQFQSINDPIATTVQNTGRTVSVKIPSGNKPILSGATLNGPYIFNDLHFHWPSEHTINGNSFQLEAHLVFYSTQYPNLTEAVKNRGVAVVGVLYNVCATGPRAFDILAAAAQNVSKNVGSTVTTAPIVIRQLLPTNISAFYLYNGSLTTPTCEEGVKWIIFRNYGFISSAQLKALTTIYDENNQVLPFTNRQIKPLNGRPVNGVY